MPIKSSTPMPSVMVTRKGVFVSTIDVFDLPVPGGPMISKRINSDSSFPVIVSSKSYHGALSFNFFAAIVAIFVSIAFTRAAGTSGSGDGAGNNSAGISAGLSLAALSAASIAAAMSGLGIAAALSAASIMACTSGMPNLTAVGAGGASGIAQLACDA